MTDGSTFDVCVFVSAQRILMWASGEVDGLSSTSVYVCDWCCAIFSISNMTDARVRAVILIAIVDAIAHRTLAKPNTSPSNHMDDER